MPAERPRTRPPSPTSARPAREATRFSHTILDAAGIAQVSGTSGRAALAKIFGAIEAAGDAGNLREVVFEELGARGLDQVLERGVDLGEVELVAEIEGAAGEDSLPAAKDVAEFAAEFEVEDEARDRHNRGTIDRAADRLR